MECLDLIFIGYMARYIDRPIPICIFIFRTSVTVTMYAGRACFYYLRGMIHVAECTLIHKDKFTQQ